MKITLDKAALAAIEDILNRGRDCIIYRQKDGVVVSEQTRKVIHRTAPSGE